MVIIITLSDCYKYSNIKPNQCNQHILVYMLISSSKGHSPFTGAKQLERAHILPPSHFSTVYLSET